MQLPPNPVAATSGRDGRVVAENQAPAPVAAVLLLDTSGSMAAIDNDDDLRRRIDRLADIVRTALAEAPGARVVAFGHQVRELIPPEPGAVLILPEPNGGTPLAEALRLVAE